jgi:hypothetical protein
MPLVQLPRWLTNIPRPLNDRMIYELVTRQGGMCELAVQIHPRNALKLGHLRMQAGSSMPYEPVSHIKLFDQYPASGRKYYEMILSKLARNFKPFEISLRHAFQEPDGISTRRVSFNVWGTQLRQVHEAVLEEIKDVTPLRISGVAAPPKLSVLIEKGLDKEQADLMLEAVEKIYVGPVFATVTGFAVRHGGQPHFRSVVEYKDEDMQWKHFPFAESKAIGEERKMEREVESEIESETENVERQKAKRRKWRTPDTESEKRQRPSWKDERKKWKTSESGLFLPM